MTHVLIVIRFRIQVIPIIRLIELWVTALAKIIWVLY
jgi:hypothetical protein